MCIIYKKCSVNQGSQQNRLIMDVFKKNSAMTPGGYLGIPVIVTEGGAKTSLGLKFAIWGLLGGYKFCGDFFGQKIFGEDLKG